MPPDLPNGEPAVASWTPATVHDLLDLIRSAAPAPPSGPRVVAVDGRSAGGKSTVAARLHAAVPRSAVVHTDDVAWNHSFFGWADLLRTGVLEPVRRGEAVSYRPPAWLQHDRPGAVTVPAGLDLLVVEGVGAGQRQLGPVVDAVVWVQSDPVEAGRRGVARDVASGVNGDEEQTVAFWHEWAAQELPFLAEERPWERACVVVLGTPPPELPPEEVLLAAAGR